MDRNHEQEQGKGSPEKERPGRTWAERLSGPIRYRHFVDTDPAGRVGHFFKFELAPGQSDLPQEVYDILHEMKKLTMGRENGGGQYHTGLTFNRSKKHGRVWVVPNTLTGRTAALVIDARLAKLARKLQGEEEVAARIEADLKRVSDTPDEGRGR